MAFQHELPDPLVPLLAGWLAGALDGEGRKVLSITSITLEPSSGMMVRFASGKTLVVSVREFGK